jgi:hypothetical protein
VHSYTVLSMLLIGELQVTAYLDEMSKQDRRDSIQLVMMNVASELQKTYAERQQAEIARAAPEFQAWMSAQNPVELNPK